MSHSLFLLFNHELTSIQVEDATGNLGVNKIIDLPADLKELWRQVPPELTAIQDYLRPIKRWLIDNARKLDFVCIQGDFGACYIMVNLAFEKGLIPVYSTTEREATEEHLDNGAVKLSHVFRHRGFRRYGM